MMRNRPEFHVADTAVLLLGATPISIYNSSEPEQVQYLAGHCDASVAIVEDIGYLERFLKVRSELPMLKHLAVIEDPHQLAPQDVLRWDALRACAADKPRTSVADLLPNRWTKKSSADAALAFEISNTLSP